jgi:uncharacterized protein
MKIAVTGASGFVGQRLCAVARARGHDVIELGRSGNGRRRWDPLSEPAPLEGAEAVIHLAGEPLTHGRWTRAKMARIRDSRVIGTRNLVYGMRKAGLTVLASASAVGFYGDRGESVLTERSASGTDFLATVCRDWEAEASESGIRTAILRTGTVLGPGGALEMMAPPFGMYLGGKLGSGLQWMSWIHRDDLVELYLQAVTDDRFSGPYLAVSPNVVRSREFTSTLAQVMNRPSVFRIPRWGVRLAFGKVVSVLYGSQRCRPERTLETGFQFSYPTIETALVEAVSALRHRKEAAA